MVSEPRMSWIHTGENIWLGHIQMKCQKARGRNSRPSLTTQIWAQVQQNSFLTTQFHAALDASFLQLMSRPMWHLVSLTAFSPPLRNTHSWLDNTCAWRLCKIIFAWYITCARYNMQLQTQNWSALYLQISFCIVDWYRSPPQLIYFPENSSNYTAKHWIYGLNIENWIFQINHWWLHIDQPNCTS